MKPTTLLLRSKQSVWIASITMWLFSCIAPQFAHAQVVSSTQNPSQIATLHWYAANLTTTFSVGPNPAGMVFDGTALWVGNEGSNTVTKLQPSDGKVLGTFEVGNGPFALAYDGANIWTDNFTDNTATKLQASTGTVLGTFPVGNRPAGIAFDGTNIWVPNTVDNTVTKLKASNGTISALLRSDKAHPQSHSTVRTFG
jgi:DNA-binding beta-propeller fold protein YncE